jgi:hypothetical protein
MLQREALWCERRGHQAPNRRSPDRWGVIHLLRCGTGLILRLNWSMPLVSRDRPLRSSLKRIRSQAGEGFNGLARSVGLPDDITAVIGDAVRDLGQATGWRGGFRSPVKSTRAVVDHALDRTAGLCLTSRVAIESSQELDRRSGLARKGVAAGGGRLLRWLAAAGVATAVGTDGLSLPAVVALDVILGQVLSMIEGISEWYLVGVYTAWLLRQAGIEPDPRTLRRIVDAALLSRGGKSLDGTVLDPVAERRLVTRWIWSGTLDALPGLSWFGGRSVRHAGHCLERTDLVALHARIVSEQAEKPSPGLKRMLQEPNRGDEAG